MEQPPTGLPHLVTKKFTAFLPNFEILLRAQPSASFQPEASKRPLAMFHVVRNPVIPWGRQPGMEHDETM